MFKCGVPHKLSCLHGANVVKTLRFVRKLPHRQATISLNKDYHTKTKTLFSARPPSSQFTVIQSSSFLSRDVLFKLQCRFYALPPHNKMLLPALSPTMKTGTIVRWEVKEGDSFVVGDLLADIETDKATMGFEAIDDGFMAKIILPEGSKDVPVGCLVAVSVENEEDIAAFKDVKPDELEDGTSTAGATASVPEATSTVQTSTVAQSNVNFPSHERVTLPALSPTMTTGTIISWEIKEGEKIEEGDAIATIETDKATMAMEFQDEGYLAKILVKEGSKDLPLGTPMCIVVPNKEDIAAFANYVDAGDSPAAATVSAPAPPPSDGQSIPPPTPAVQSQVPERKPSGDRIFISPLAKKLALERGINLSQLAGLGSGPGGRIRMQDLSKATEAAPAVVQPTVATPTSSIADDRYTDIPLSNMRKVIGQRLHESKSTIPHYYLTVDIEMDTIMELRKTFNSELEKDGVKLSVNDFIIKASSLACLKVPEANSSWRDTFIRQFNKVDMSIAVSTDAGLITPIVFDAHAKGLVTISENVISLASKAREGKLQPQEFQGGTFTISNLGMFGVKHFTAIINPPQACILAVGGARRELLPDANAENGIRPATLMSVTLSCDHRVVDGAVGAQWLQYFKKFLEDPTKMLL